MAAARPRRSRLASGPLASSTIGAWTCPCRCAARLPARWRSGVPTLQTAKIKGFVPVGRSDRASLYDEALPPGLILVELCACEERAMSDEDALEQWLAAIATSSTEIGLEQSGRQAEDFAQGLSFIRLEVKRVRSAATRSRRSRFKTAPTLRAKPCRADRTAASARHQRAL
jgi:hypothetical protein